jgi:hypothetical protein
MNPSLTSALSEFSKGRWATGPLNEPPLHPTERKLITRARSWLDKLAPITFARYLIAFFIGVIATLAWQSYRGTKEEIVVAASDNLVSMRQSIDNLATEITKLQAAEQDILDKVSTPPPRPAATPVRNPEPRPTATLTRNPEPRSSWPSWWPFH